MKSLKGFFAFERFLCSEKLREKDFLSKIQTYKIIPITFFSSLLRLLTTSKYPKVILIFE